MKEYLSSVLAAAFSVCVFTLSAKAEWAKSYDWDDSKDQTWTSYDNGGKHYVSTGDWEIEYSVGDGDDISITYVKTVGTSSLLNFDTIERDTGKRVISISGFKQKSTLTDVVFPSSLTTVGGSAFHSCPITSDLVFSSDHAVSIGDSAFYSTKVRSITLKGAGSTIVQYAFSGVTSWVGTSDISGATSIGNSAFQNGANKVHANFELIISPAVTSIGANAFQKHRNLKVSVAQPKIISEIPETDGTIGANAFYDTSATLGQYFTLTIPFRGGCTVGNDAFHWMQKCNNFEFWGKAPTFSSSSFSSLGNSYAIRITGCVEMDPTGWAALATPCTDTEKARADYPGDDVCLGTYTTGSGATFWVCKGKSPYTASSDSPVLDGVSVVRTANGLRFSGSLIQGAAEIAAHLGDLVFPLTDGGVPSPAQFDVELTVGDGQGQIPAGETYAVSVVADDGSEQSVWTAQDPIYTGMISIQMIKAASEVGFESGIFRISRGDENTASDVEVSYATSGTAVAGKNYEALTGKVMIPDGESYVDIEIRPIYDAESTDGTTLVLTLTDGNYFVSDTEGAAEMFIAGSSVSLLDIYIDALAAEGGNGTESSPYKTIKEGVQACAANGTVHVKGGADRTYDIATLDDFVTFARDGIAVAPWVADERVKIVLARGLHKLNANPKVFTVLDGADGVKFSGLDVLLYAGGNQNDDYSIKGSDTSAVFSISGNGAVFEDCSFEIEGSCKEGLGGYIVRTTAEQNSPRFGQNITIRDCRFANLREYFFRSGLNPTFVGNSVTNCSRLVWPLKAAYCDFTFVSNRLVNCGTFKTTVPNWNELQKGVFAYNIFVTEDGTPFITKGAYGLTDKDVYIHHNTVIGGPLVSVLNSTVSWMPKIFDNLVSSPDGYVIVETGTAFASGDFSSFKTDGGAFFRNNAYLSAGLNGGTATEVAGYDLSKGLLIENNVVLAGLPKFQNTTDATNPGYYRPRVEDKADPLLKGGWTGDGVYPAYIGAVKPYFNGSGSGLLIYVR